ncbi:MAG: TlpA family protein disulfide reductase [Planctomycetaceae bacterium]|nr:TlpA family protein disulfide reductase [Planctomycetaceae bacterium]
MCLNRRIGRPVGAMLLTCAVLTCSACVRADDQPPQDPPGEASATGEITLPEGSDAVSIQTFVQGMVRDFQTRGAEFRSEEGTIRYLNNMDAALASLLERKLEEEPGGLVANVRLQVLDVLAQLKEPTAQKRVDGLLAMLRKSESADLRWLADRQDIQGRLASLETMPPAEVQELIDLIGAKLQEKPIRQDVLNLAQSATDMLQALDKTEASLKAYTVFIAAIKSHQDERLDGLVESLEGAARFAGLQGNAIEVSGTTLDGQDFNIKQLAGKVVLVDFWATWCGPCIGELPNVKENYERYHDKGFEVVGISLDDNPEKLKQFLEAEQIPWVTLFPADENQRGWENPIARHYGISGIPTVILVNQEGKVVNLNARGPALGEELAKLLGPPAPSGN